MLLITYLETYIKQTSNFPRHLVIDMVDSVEGKEGKYGRGWRPSYGGWRGSSNIFELSSKKALFYLV